MILLKDYSRSRNNFARIYFLFAWQHFASVRDQIGESLEDLNFNWPVQVLEFLARKNLRSATF